eukprot:TRINITY_DN19432_c0_g1_i1.p1 TRINITY_DN19432_c0_g1~~TRINITY_DN19432_c0_g1_i1.p1  ORF type:complete len:106 (-),score=7.77 TRINITY_DN19432_c0_g1_i1:224-541(-)
MLDSVTFDFVRGEELIKRRRRNKLSLHLVRELKTSNTDYGEHHLTRCSQMRTLPSKVGFGQLFIGPTKPLTLPFFSEEDNRGILRVSDQPLKSNKAALGVYEDEE